VGVSGSVCIDLEIQNSLEIPLCRQQSSSDASQGAPEDTIQVEFRRQSADSAESCMLILTSLLAILGVLAGSSLGSALVL
jgi:hypothetical protein